MTPKRAAQIIMYAGSVIWCGLILAVTLYVVLFTIPTPWNLAAAPLGALFAYGYLFEVSEAWKTEESDQPNPPAQLSMPVEECDPCKTNFMDLSKLYALEKQRHLRMRIALQLLVNRLEGLDKDESLNGIFTIAAIHGFKYDGPTWGPELSQAKKILEEDQ